MQEYIAEDTLYPPGDVVIEKGQPVDPKLVGPTDLGWLLDQGYISVKSPEVGTDEEDTSNSEEVIGNDNPVPARPGNPDSRRRA